MPNTRTDNVMLQRLEAILQAIETQQKAQEVAGANQARAMEGTISRLNSLADKLEPLVPLLEGQIAGMDGNISRLEEMTAALVKTNRQLRELYLVEKQEIEEQKRQEHEGAIL